jgi:hypothetical protein
MHPLCYPCSDGYSSSGSIQACLPLLQLLLVSLPPLPQPDHTAAELRVVRGARICDAGRLRMPCSVALVLDKLADAQQQVEAALDIAVMPELSRYACCACRCCRWAAAVQSDDPLMAKLRPLLAGESGSARVAAWVGTVDGPRCMTLSNLCPVAFRVSSPVLQPTEGTVAVACVQWR